MLMVISTKDGGSMIKPMEKELIPILMGLSIKAIGFKIRSTVMELRHGRMDPFTKGTIEKERSIAEVSNALLMAVIMKDNFLMIKNPVSVSSSGQMKDYMKVNGAATKCMVKASSSGMTIDATKDSSKMMSVPVLGHLPGSMDGNT